MGFYLAVMLIRFYNINSPTYYMPIKGYSLVAKSS